MRGGNNMNPDTEVAFHFIEDFHYYEGCRPAHLIRDNYLTTGVHSYYNNDNVTDQIIGTITFISPEYYPNSLWIGKRIEMYVGSKMIGYAEVLKVFNKILEVKNPLV